MKPSDFQHVVCVNLDRRHERWVQFEDRVDKMDWPFPKVQRWRAFDGYKVPLMPTWWNQGKGAWGCFRSHLDIIERAIMEEWENVLIFEDDCVFRRNFPRDVTAYLEQVPDDWGMLYLGGQNLGKVNPKSVQDAPLVRRPWNVNRTHAYAINGWFAPTLYQHLLDFKDWVNYPRHHIDHRYGVLQERQKHPIYIPTKWLCGQAAGDSDVSSKEFATDRFWMGRDHHKDNRPMAETRKRDLVVVLGTHRSGSSCLAGILHTLGVHMGNQFVGPGRFNKKGTYEAIGLAKFCEEVYPYPKTYRQLNFQETKNRLQNFVGQKQEEAKRKSTVAGLKYPHLCAMQEEFEDLNGINLVLINSERDLDASIASNKARAQESRRLGNKFLGVPDEEAEAVQRWLYEKKLKFLEAHNHLTVNYEDVVRDTKAQIERIISYLGLNVDEERIQLAVRGVQEELKHF